MPSPLNRNADMPISPQPDIQFLRNTGLTLVTATLMAGAVLLSLTLTERKPVVIASNADHAGVTAAEAAVAIPFDHASRSQNTKYFHFGAF
jgi:hypothetical protein